METKKSQERTKDENKPQATGGGEGGGVEKVSRGRRIYSFGIFAGGHPAANQRPHTDFVYSSANQLIFSARFTRLTCMIDLF